MSQVKQTIIAALIASILTAVGTMSLAYAGEKNYHTETIMAGLQDSRTADTAEYCADICGWLDAAEGSVLPQVQANCDLCAAAIRLEMVQ